MSGMGPPPPPERSHKLRTAVSDGWVFWWSLLGVAKESCHVQLRVLWLFSLLICIFLFVSCSSTLLNRNGEGEHPCFIPDFLRKLTQFFFISYTVGCRFLHLTFIRGGMFLLFLDPSGLYAERMNFVERFSILIWMTMLFLVVIRRTCYSTSVGLCMLS